MHALSGSLSQKRRAVDYWTLYLRIISVDIKNVREVLLPPVACMQMQTLLRAAAHEWVLMIAFTETTKGRLVLREPGISIWEYETMSLSCS